MATSRSTPFTYRAKAGQAVIRAGRPTVARAAFLATSTGLVWALHSTAQGRKASISSGTLRMRLRHRLEADFSQVTSESAGCHCP